ncbi:MAG: CHAT domain-containing protein [Gammaproteobacteria bacterium]|nr:CHAT domain-containing protein [Gammaproteobacteria bacterium]MBU1556333.1 CHAT domain-containing protein [Gammaproteobacteria bacterium]MBU2071525.1 CHAT domain-containing protein [Gammaproteobacteria bacterium]MBU2184016.1 CHAT domain-containing protein [Gammaproteobacteria bacterium]MBU2206898.1 CHAT domain-containing protein [Gammaproteobacteria bacterium]
MTSQTTIQFAVRTSSQDATEPTDADYQVRSFKLAGGEKRAMGSTQMLNAETGKDLVHLVLKDNSGQPFDLWLHPEHARDLLLSQQGGKLATDGTVQVPANAQWRSQDGAQRGFISDVLIDTLELLGLKKKAAKFTSAAIGARIDSKVNEGVYRLSEQTIADLKQATTCQLDAVSHPQLVFIHGTFSNTQAGFAGWWQHQQQIQQLFSHYHNQIYALDHATVLKSPLFNALTLAKALPKRATLHLVTHSRGGLVAECLLRALMLAADKQLFDQEISDYFQDDAYSQHKQELTELVKLLKSKDIRIERLVRVACPAHGTLLASDRLDAYLSVLNWLAKRANIPLLPGLLDFTKAVARERTDPASLTGIEAMRAQSAVIRWLNAPLSAGCDSQLRVVAGDIAGDSLVSWIKTLLADSFYRTDNDLVVQTSAMYGGVLRRDARFILESSGKTDHFNYFSNLSTASAITEALTQQQPSGFLPVGPLSYQGKSASGVRASDESRFSPNILAANDLGNTAKPLVLVLPGIAGSHLQTAGRREWLALHRAFGMLDRIRLRDNDNIEADGVLETYYQTLIEQLALQYEVLPFSYDWRRSLEDSATALAAVLRQQLAHRPNAAIHLVAHSMGSLVFRVLQIVEPQLWQSWLNRPNTRVMLLGPPNNGSWAPMTMLTGDDSFANMLCRLNGDLQTLESRELIADFTGLLQLQAGLHDPQHPMAQQAYWHQLAEADQMVAQDTNPWFSRFSKKHLWAIPNQSTLDKASLLRHKLNAQLPVIQGYQDKIGMILGSSPQTPAGFVVNNQGALRYQFSPDGDGRVCWQDSVIAGIPTWLSPQVHGALAKDKNVIAACQQWLAGNVMQPSGLQPFYLPERRSEDGKGSLVTKPRVDADTTYSAYPLDEAAMMQALFIDSTVSRQQGLQSPPLVLNVHNDDLRFVRQPLLLGHVNAMQLTGSEQAVDQLLGGDLQLALQSGVYPVVPGQYQIFVNRQQNVANPLAYPKPVAAIVVGLGDEGELTPAAIRRTVQAGVIGYCLQQQRQISQLELAVTILGSGGIVTVSQSVQALVQGVLDANEKLQQLAIQRPHRTVAYVGRLLIIEQFHSRALEAWHTLHDWSALNKALPLELTKQVTNGNNGISQPVDGHYRSVKYDLLRVSSRPLHQHRPVAAGLFDSSSHLLLEFALFTRRARSELYYKEIQVAQIRELLHNSEVTGNFDQTLAKTLFHLVLPHELKASLAACSELVLELDNYTAWIPWELLIEGAVQHQASDPDNGQRFNNNVLRKLRLREFRRQPTASLSDKILVIGEPLVDESVAPLPGAVREAKQVAKVFASRAQLLLNSSSSDIFKAALSHDWQIVHLAGHGLYCPSESGQSHSCKTGMLLQNDIVFGPAEFDSMQHAPELVFVNCCELGKTEQLNTARYQAFAANVGEQLIRSGVRCVVVAAWAVADQAAEAFAGNFYQALLQNMTFARAVQAGRKAAFAAAPHDNTWAAYQCYGDPAWRLVDNEQTCELQTPPLASARELLLTLEQLQTQAANSSDGERSGLQNRLMSILRSSNNSWLQQGQVAEQIAHCWLALGVKDLALHWFSTAVNAADGSASFVAREQQLNLQVRLATDEATLKAATQQLQHLIELAPTAERYNLLGSAWKRRVMLIDNTPTAKATGNRAQQPAKPTSTTELTAALEQMVVAYQQAADLRATDVFYPLSQLYLAKLRLHWLNAKHQPPTDDDWQKLQQLYQQQAEQEADFWNHVGPLEAVIWQAMQQQQLHLSLPEVSTQLQELQLRVSSVNWWQSVRDTADFIGKPYLQHIQQNNLAAAESTAAQQLMQLLARFATSGDK